MTALPSSPLEADPAHESPGYWHTTAAEAAMVVELPHASFAPRVSVVVPTFNHRELVLELLDAMRKELSPDDEIVVVDDGSIDDSFSAIVAKATLLGLRGRVIRLHCNQGRSTARNVGIMHARGEVIAFTDGDCIPAPGWLTAGAAALSEQNVGIAQGRTAPRPDQRQPFFSHFIEIKSFDGTFSTCNVFYRKDALLATGGFDPGVEYWEDVDLGWRVRRAGWEAVFAPDALVYHQVLPLSPARWLRWPLHFGYMPAKVARYPEYRQYLFLGLWVHWSHALFDLAVLSLLLAWLARRRFALFSVPYLVVFPFRHGLRGRWPLAKAALHLAWDAFSLAVLLTSSARNRALVL